MKAVITFQSILTDFIAQSTMDIPAWRREHEVERFVELLCKDAAYTQRAQDGILGIKRIASNIEKKVYTRATSERHYTGLISDQIRLLESGSFDPGFRSEEYDGAGDLDEEADVGGLAMPLAFVDYDEFEEFAELMTREQGEVGNQDQGNVQIEEQGEPLVLNQEEGIVQIEGQGEEEAEPLVEGIVQIEEQGDGSHGQLEEQKDGSHGQIKEQKDGSDDTSDGPDGEKPSGKRKAPEDRGSDGAGSSTTAKRGGGAHSSGSAGKH